MEEDKVIKIDKPKLEFDQIADFFGKRIVFRKAQRRKMDNCIG